nr:uncharacterized protein LOC129269381 [Lytechinus pictus]
MKHESKTIHVDERPSFAGSLVTIFAGQGARAADSKTTRENLPGKSRVGRILLNDNHSQDRLLGMKLADIHQMQRKAETFISHQQKTFLAKMEKRQDTWVREHIRFSNGTNLIRQPDDDDEDVPPTRETYKSFLEGGERQGVDSSDATKGDDGTLPAITYLTEGADNSNSTKNVGNGATVFLKEPDVTDRTPNKGFVGLPPITQAKKSGFAPSGNVDDVFDDMAFKRSARKWPPVKSAEDGTGSLPVIDLNDPRTGTAGKESKMSAIEELEEFPDKCSPIPKFLLSRSLPLMQLEEPQSRKLRARREHQPKLRRKRSRNMSARVIENDNPLSDDRFVKLHALLASEVVADHESRELSAITRGFLAAKRFGQGWKKN